MPHIAKLEYAGIKIPNTVLIMELEEFKNNNDVYNQIKKLISDIDENDSDYKYYTILINDKKISDQWENFIHQENSEIPLKIKSYDGPIEDIKGKIIFKLNYNMILFKCK